MLEHQAPTSETRGDGVALPADFAAAAASLRNGDAVERVEAARALAACGEAAVPLLCRALTDPVVPVRLAAAKALGQIGDPAAIPALSEAMNACFIGGSARRQLATGYAATIGLTVACVLMVVFSPVSAIEVLLRSGVQGLWNLGQPKVPVEAPRSRAPVYARALVTIAEGSPSPELRHLLPELRAASLDVLSLDRESRTASREIAERLDRLTTRLKSLPTPASAPTHLTNAALPIAATGAGPRGALPVPGDGG